MPRYEIKVTFMRFVHGIFLAIMLLFMGVQYNDPDGPLWVLIYTVPALLMVACVARPVVFTKTWGRALRWAGVMAMAVGMVYFWPRTSEFWRQEVWWETETAREGMGMMIAFIVAASAYLAAKKP